MLDGLFDHDTILDIEELFTDTGGASDQFFGFFPFIRKRFAPQLCNIKDRKFHTFEKADSYPALANHIGTPINTTLVMDHWDDLLRLGASVTSRTVAPSRILKQFSASLKSGEFAKALREVGRIERTLLMIEWYSNPSLRRRCRADLNKGEAAHKLKRAVFFHERGESGTARMIIVRLSVLPASTLWSAPSYTGTRSNPCPINDGCSVRFRAVRVAARRWPKSQLRADQA